MRHWELRGFGDRCVYGRSISDEIWRVLSLGVLIEDQAMYEWVKVLLLAGPVAAVSLRNTEAGEPLPKCVKSTITYREVDGHSLLADVYRPDDVTVRPAIVWIHGGALIMGHRESIPANIMNLVRQQEYALVSIDYRLAPESKLPAIISDIEAAFRWLANDGARAHYLDPTRVLVAGGSAGGYLTLVTGYRADPKPKALVALWGYGDLIGDWYSKPSPHPRHNSRQVSRKEALEQTDGTIVSDSRKRSGNGGLIYLHCRQTGTWPKVVSGFDPENEAAKIAPFEPVRNVTKDYPPTFLIHGTDDTDVPFEQSEMMVEKFKEHGVPYTLKAIQGGEHGLGGGDPTEIHDAYDAMSKFIIQMLGRA